ncbi:MAG: PepSY domain-containing protein [Helicobacteraceae bacterium]|nr:PepSY domain-containing protein [Helicobacteraceae bacterium]
MKKYFHKIHIYISIFFLPMALMYAITGTLYIFGIEENSGAITNTYKVESKNKLIEENMADFMIKYLRDNNLKLPQNLVAKNSRNGIQIGGIYYSASIKNIPQNANSIKDSQNITNVYEITTIQRSIYGSLVLLHKSKGKFYFDIIATAFGIALIVLYLSGLIITSFCIKRRGKAVFTFTIGLLTLAILAYLSV